MGRAIQTDRREGEIMKSIERRTLIKGLGAAVTLAPGLWLLAPARARAAGTSPRLTKIHRDYLVTPEEVRRWHAEKDSMGGPTIAGSPSWRNFVELAERELRASGVVDVLRNSWSYSRWQTGEWPDDSAWGLTIEGREIPIASYGCNSGRTPDAGVTGELVVFEDGMPREALAGKIAVLVKEPAQEILAGGARSVNATAIGDYEYLSSPETFPDPLTPMAEIAPVSPFLQMGLGAAQQTLVEAGALGAVIVLGLSFDAAAGTYTFPVPALHQMPTLYADVETGRALVAAAKAEKRATLRLVSETHESETYQLFGFLPGRRYGTPEDEQILLITHTDGPSISQENGALGIAAVVRYFARIPQSERPRTLMVFLDCRHYMPGMERAFASQDHAASHPELYDKVIAAMGIEHLGQIKVSEEGGKYHRTDLAEVSSIWVTESERLVEIAIQAAKDNRLARVQVQCPGRPGVHGKPQGRSYGLGAIAGRLGVAGASAMGLMSAYWSSKARLDDLDAEHFVDQVATMSQICGELMLAEVAAISGEAGG
jgi:hypothetical protein